MWEGPKTERAAIGEVQHNQDGDQAEAGQTKPCWILKGIKDSDIFPEVTM